MFRSDVIKKVGFFSEFFNGCEDWEFWLRLSRYYEIKNLPEVLTFLNNDYGSLSRDVKFRKRFKRRVKKLILLVQYFKWYYWESYLGIMLNLFIIFINIILPPVFIINRRRILKNIIK
jgi:hypothetical protein